MKYYTNVLFRFINKDRFIDSDKRVKMRENTRIR